jgi:hypothetical protein
MRSLFFPWGVILQLIAIVHFVRRRPETYWLWIIILFGPLGAFAYVIAEMIPDLGLMRHSMGGFSRRKRISILRATVLENPAPGNYEELGDLLLEEKKYREARDCFDRALGQRTDHVDPFYRRGIAAFELGDAAAALPDLERVVKSDPKYDYSRARLFYARALAAVGRTEEAIGVFQTLVESSGTTEALCYAAEYFAQHGRKEDAKALLDRITARKRTMPAYQKRRERPWLRRASALNRRLLIRTG